MTWVLSGALVLSVLINIRLIRNIRRLLRLHEDASRLVNETLDLVRDANTRGLDRESA
jgi:hypothetical protein